MSDNEKDITERYLRELTGAGILEDLQKIPNKNDYPTTSDWMRALERYRDEQIAPRKEDNQDDHA